MADKTLTPDVLVIGAGSGGLTVAAGASQMGADVVLLEGGKMGGDCLNYGCVPSKALIAAGHHAHMMRHGQGFGIANVEPEVDFPAVKQHVADVIKTIEPMDSVERFEGFGVTVLQEYGRFTGPKEVQAGDTTIKPKWIVIATGSSAAVPPIPGLDSVPYHTNESLFEDETAPEHLVIIGGGPIGVEMAQAHRRLGSQVTVLDMGTILANDDPELVAIARASLEAEGIDLREKTGITQVEKGDGDTGIKVLLNDGTYVHGSHLLVAAGRKPNLDKLDLEKGGIAYERGGITVDDRLRTSDKRVFAIGDVAGGPQFTHVAGYHGGIVIRNMLFRLPAKVDYKALPWVTYADPELANVGLTEKQATEEGHKINVLRWEFEENDRAQAQRLTKGLVKVIVTPKGKILGAGIVGPNAGELILSWGLAIQNGLKIGAMASVIAPYPTMAEVSKRAAGSYYTPKIFSDRIKSIVRFLMKF
ncbi:MAG: FAD-dependent oxidoreductase [Alphaproteobacteria bacterium]